MNGRNCFSLLFWFFEAFRHRVSEQCCWVHPREIWWHFTAFVKSALNLIGSVVVPRNTAWPMACVCEPQNDVNLNMNALLWCDDYQHRKGKHVRADIYFQVLAIDVIIDKRIQLKLCKWQRLDFQLIIFFFALKSLSGHFCHSTYCSLSTCNAACSRWFYTFVSLLLPFFLWLHNLFIIRGRVSGVCTYYSVHAH